MALLQKNLMTKPLDHPKKRHFATLHPQIGILQPFIRKWHFVTFYPQNGILQSFIRKMAFCYLLSAKWHFATFYPQNGIWQPFSQRIIRKVVFWHPIG